MPNFRKLVHRAAKTEIVTSNARSSLRSGSLVLNFFASEPDLRLRKKGAWEASIPHHCGWHWSYQNIDLLACITFWLLLPPPPCRQKPKRRVGLVYPSLTSLLTISPISSWLAARNSIVMKRIVVIFDLNDLSYNSPRNLIYGFKFSFGSSVCFFLDVCATATWMSVRLMPFRPLFPCVLRLADITWSIGTHNIMSRSIPTLTIPPPGTPPGICTENIPGPRAFDSQSFPGPRAFDKPRDIQNVYSIYCIGAWNLHYSSFGFQVSLFLGKHFWIRTREISAFLVSNFGIETWSSEAYLISWMIQGLGAVNVCWTISQTSVCV